MRTYKATAVNNNGDSFQFNFLTTGWGDIERIARGFLQKVIEEDSLHQKNGPWNVIDIDVTV